MMRQTGWLVSMTTCVKQLLFAVFLCIGTMLLGHAQSTDSALKISPADERAILHDAHLTRTGKYYKIRGCDDPVSVEMQMVDLNSDGNPEVILTVSGSPCFSGLMQSNVSVYVKSSKGRWRDVLGFLPAFGVRIQPVKNKGYADLELTVLGGCDPVYRWSGYAYNYVARKSSYGQKCHN